MRPARWGRAWVLLAGTFVGSGALAGCSETPSAIEESPDSAGGDTTVLDTGSKDGALDTADATIADVSDGAEAFDAFDSGSESLQSADATDADDATTDVDASDASDTSDVADIIGVSDATDSAPADVGSEDSAETSTPTTVVAVAAGLQHTCVVTTAGGVKCWGSNTYGQLGDGTTTDRLTPVDVTGLTSGVTAIAAGRSRTCALTTVGGVKCWGYGAAGALGDLTSTTRSVPGDVWGMTSGIIAIAARHHHNCALTSAGAMKCWGENLRGQLGDGTTSDKPIPVDVSGLSSGVSAISVGNEHSCALMSAGTFKCWGSNGYGQLGDGTTTDRYAPTAVSGLTAGIAVGAGKYQTCALGAGSKCWGGNTFGQVGDGTTTERNTPVDVSGLSTGVTLISGGEGDHTCALTALGAMKCWGRNSYGEVGDGTTTDRSTPVDVSGLSAGVKTFAIGDAHTCAVVASGELKCWGYNSSGQLGDGTTTNRAAPTTVAW
jgi:alpha-tubulin suppressor-like RCC1 family protein